MKSLSLLFPASILLFIMLGCVLSVHRVEASSGLVGSWSFNEGTGTTVYDSSGNGNNGAMMNAPVWSTGSYGLALAFNGADNYVEILHNETLTSSNFTIEAWIYLNSDVVGTQARVVSKQETISRSYSFDIFGKGYGGSTGNQLLLSIGNGTTWWNFLSTTHLSNQTWYHVAGTHEGTNSKIYIDGQLDKNGTTSTQTANNTGVLTIGCQKQTGTGATYFFNGTIDEVRIYNRALSQQEIQGDMIPEFPSPLILLLPMIVIPLIVLVYKKEGETRISLPLSDGITRQRQKLRA